MVRSSLSRIRARVDRLAGQIGVGPGCPVCRDDEAQTHVRWRNQGDGEPPAESTQRTCAGCGRSYEVSFILVGWMEPKEALS